MTNLQRVVLLYTDLSPLHEAAEVADLPKLDSDPWAWQGVWPKLKFLVLER